MSDWVRKVVKAIDRGLVTALEAYAAAETLYGPEGVAALSAALPDDDGAGIEAA